MVCLRLTYKLMEVNSSHEVEVSANLDQYHRVPAIVMPYDRDDQLKQSKDQTVEIPNEEAVLVNDSGVLSEGRSFVEMLGPLPSKGTVEMLKAQDRRNFVIKVFKLLMLQFAVLILGLVLMETVSDAREGINEQPWAALGCFLTSLVVLLVVFCSKNFSKKFPQNIIAMFIYVMR